MATHRDDTRATLRRSRAGVLILLLAYIVNFVDRQIISVLAVPIKADLALSDQQLGLMGGLAFALFYTSMAIPIGWLADRTSRVNIIAGSVALWSVFTALCGTAGSFWQLFLARMGVGIGEAGGVAPSYALIADLYPREKRASAIALFSLGIPIGSALGVFFGGWIAGNLSWRAAFLMVGLAGLPIAAAVKWLVREPARGRFDALPADEAGRAVAPPLGEIARYLARTPSFWLLALGAASASILSYGLLFWLPSFFARSFGLEIVEASLYFGTIVLVGGVCGILLGGWLGDRLSHGRREGFALLAATGFVLAVPTIASALFTASLSLSWALFAIGQMLTMAWIGPVTAGVQQLVPASMRAVASAVFLFVLNAVGIGFGIFFLGWMSDWMTAAYGPAALQHSMLYGLGFYLLSAILFLVAARLLATGRATIDPAEPARTPSQGTASP